MKVYIGPYRNWIGPYQIAEKILFWLDKENDRVFNLGERLSRITWLCKFCEWVDSKKKRKIQIRIDKYDTWNMDNTLALIALPMLKQLRNTKHGAPWTDDEDVPEHLRSTAAEPKENEYHTDSNHFKRWNWIMDEMIYAFEQELDEDWDTIFERERAEREAIRNRTSNGFRLFGKYYQSLWD